MKLTIVLMTIAFMGVYANGRSQSVTMSGNNIPLEKTFSTIRTQTGYLVFCDRELLSEAAPVSVSATNMPLNQFLELIFKNQSLQYLIREQTIFVSKKVTLPGVPEVLSTVPVEGIVHEAGGYPLEGATVKVKNGPVSVITNSKGYFDLNANVGDVLVITFVGFEPQEIKITNSTKLDIALKRQVINVDEVTVSVSTGYQTISKERATGSYGVITAKELENTPSVDILQRLEGKVAGVKVDPNAGTVQIRSTNTYSTTSEPLIVIDGFPMIAIGNRQQLTTRGASIMSNNAIMSTINPADIDQITFLKDAVATSVWGAKGANGVIVITTKHGKKGMPTLNLSSTVGLASAPKFSKLHWMSTADYVDLEKDLVNKGFITDSKQNPYYNPLYTTNPSEVQEWLFKAQRGEVTAAEANAAIDEISKRNNEGQIRKYLLREAISQQYNLSVSGGNDVTAYYVAANHNRDNPIYKSNGGNNTNLTTNLTNKLWNSRVTIHTGFQYQINNLTTNLAAMDALGATTTSLRPYDMLVNSDGSLIKRSIVFRPEFADSLTNLGYLPFTYNAIQELNYSNTKTSTTTARFSSGINVKITPWLNADVSGQYQRYNSTITTINTIDSYVGRMFMNTYTTISATTHRPVYSIPYGGYYYLANSLNSEYALRGQLNFNKAIRTNHHINALAGTEIRQAYTKGDNATRYGYDQDANTFGAINPTVYNMTMYGYTQQIGNNLSSITEQRNRYLSYFGNFSYNYKSKYDVSGSVRFDDYTLLGLDRSKRAKPFWSVGAKWNVQQESFLQPYSWLSNLNIRATIGTGGSVPLAGYNKAIVNLGNTDPNTQLPYGTISNPANQQLQWETTRTLNGGLDIGVFNNRLTANIDVYHKWSNGILVNQPYNSTYGWSYLWYNSGKLESHGIELGLTATWLENKDLTFSSTFNFAYSNNKVHDSRYNNLPYYSLLGGSAVINDYPIGGMFVYRSAGLDETGQTQIYDKDNKIIKSTEALPTTFSMADLKYVGVKSAPYFGGFMNNFRYKNFDLQVQITYYMGGKFIKPSVSGYPQYASFYGVLGRQKDFADRWRTAGDEAHTIVPGLDNLNYNSFNRYQYSDKLVRSADNIRLQQISLGYHFPDRLLPKKVIKSLAISGNVRNLGMIWAANKEKYDPQYLNANSSYYSAPPVTSYLFNINASF
ncbi:SusC/RagA family TonB-linked outer membrane protein [Chitinophaga sp.]|uniref:SusC/RagA family TonB-linked outer membrane protein n=1 Tax=Chitinophaga sp. TaxID=1869181 RepID=UPI0031E0BE06